MSIWTHVTGIIRIETSTGLFEKDIEKMLGKKILYSSNEVTKELYKTNPEKFMPRHLNYHIYNHNYKYELPSCVISIFGDIDDYSDSEAILKWFKSSIEKSNYNIRQACITIKGLSDITWSI